MKILIPAYQPNDKLIDLIKELKKDCDFGIIIVDDGSGNDYANIFDQAKKLDCEVISYPENHGKGYALKTGIQYLKEINEPDGFVSADADGQHLPSDIIKIAKLLLEKKHDLIIGTRDFSLPEIPLRNKFGNKFSIIMFNSMTGISLNDTQTGLRAYSSSLFDNLLNTEGNRYEYEFNFLLKIKENNIDFIQMPIETVYDGNKSSHFRPIKDSILIYKPVAKFFISSIVSALLDFILLFVFKSLTNNLLYSVVLARIISSLFNFIVNRNIVFNNKNGKLSSHFIKYYSLAIIILGLNYLSLHLLNEILGMPLVIAKIIVEIVLYTLSFIAQKRFVFKNKSWQEILYMLILQTTNLERILNMFFIANANLIALLLSLLLLNNIEMFFHVHKYAPCLTTA